MNVRNIALVGDSWAWGEWSFVGDKNWCTHPGIAHYLQIQYPDANIVNFAKAGGSNLYQIDTINSEIGGTSVNDVFDIVVCFWTNPGRDVLNTLITMKEENDLYTLNHWNADIYQQFCEKSAKKSLQELNKLNSHVILIGGQVSLPEIDRDLYPNIYPVVDRMANLITKPLWDIAKSVSVHGEATNKIEVAPVTLLMNTSNPYNFNEQFIADMQQKSKDEIVDYNYEYFPDLGHGGRKLHQLAATKIIDLISSDFNEG